MKRFYQIDKNTLKKLDYKILFPKDMRFAHYKGDKFTTDILYELKGIVVHK